MRNRAVSPARSRGHEHGQAPVGHPQDSAAGHGEHEVVGSRVQLTRRTCTMASQLALLEEIRQAGADDPRAVVITPVWEQESLIWHREFADALADRIAEAQ
jgi:hypothetical protein